VLSVFGSSARDEARDDSDIDLLVEFGRPIGLLEFSRLRRELEAVLGRHVDLVTTAALRPQLRESILKEAVRAA
jgi:predicted nucleotidyltransferase